MKYEDFMALTEEEQRAAYISQEELDNITAERDSYRDENTRLQADNAEIKKSEAETKKLNYTLARKLDTAPKKDAEELLHDMFK